MIGYELFLVSKPGETWVVTRACKEHRSPDIVGKPWVRMEGDIHPCTNGCLYEKVLGVVETPTQTYTFGITDAIERCAKIAEAEPEPDGMMPAENYAAALAESLKTGVGIPEICARAAVRAVRESIAKKIRATSR